MDCTVAKKLFGLYSCFLFLRNLHFLHFSLNSIYFETIEKQYKYYIQIPLVMGSACLLCGLESVCMCVAGGKGVD